MSELNIVLSSLKNNISRDPEGLLNEVFKPDSIGSDLKISLLSMLNLITEKNTYHYSCCMQSLQQFPRKQK